MSVRTSQADRFIDLARWASSLDWPINESQSKAIAEQREWPLLDDEPGSGGIYDSGLNEERAWASFRITDGDLSDISIFATFLPLASEAPEVAGQLADEFAEQVEAAQTVLGPPSARKPGINGSVTWDLPNKGEVEIGRTDISCQWSIVSPRVAEMYRTPGGDDPE